MFGGVSENTAREIVITTIRNHPKDCVFESDAVQKIMGRLFWAKDQMQFIDICEESLKAVEIYCPHEGIDRRHLYAGG